MNHARDRRGDEDLAGNRRAAGEYVLNSSNPVALTFARLARISGSGGSSLSARDGLAGYAAGNGPRSGRFQPSPKRTSFLYLRWCNRIAHDDGVEAPGFLCAMNQGKRKTSKGLQPGLPCGKPIARKQPVRSPCMRARWNRSSAPDPGALGQPEIDLLGHSHQFE